HLILQAQELGIGSCWIGWFDEKALKQELKLPRDKKIDIVIALGFPEEDKAVPKTRKTLAEISSFNKYA
ncbi:MAG: nitroreductase family protein, partial [Candidatus Omnitrophota bacterium]